MEVYYYRRNNLSVDSISSLNHMSLSKDTILLFATQDKEQQAQLEKEHKIIYSTFPEWVKYFNVTGWVDRTKFWKVYEIKSLPKK